MESAFVLNSLDDTKKEQLIEYTTRIPPSLHKQFKDIARREGRTQSKIITELMTEYAKNHGSGNPVYKLDNWKDPDFKITPAFFAPNNTWKDYIQKCNPTEQNELDSKLIGLSYMLKKKIQYGDVNVRTY
jgi:hypothetical protein